MKLPATHSSLRSAGLRPGVLGAPRRLLAVTIQPGGALLTPRRQGAKVQRGLSGRGSGHNFGTGNQALQGPSFHRVSAPWRLGVAILLNPDSEVRGARPPRALLDAPSRPAFLACEGLQVPAQLPAANVFREGVENSARGGRAPRSTSEFGLNGRAFANSDFQNNPTPKPQKSLQP